MRLDQITVYRIVYRCVLAQDERTLLYRSCSCSLCCRFWLRRKKTGGEREREIRSPCGSFPEGSLQVPPSLHSPPDAGVTQWTTRFGFIFLFFFSSLPASVLWWCCCLFHMRDMRSEVEPMDASGAWASLCYSSLPLAYSAQRHNCSSQQTPSLIAPKAL